MGEILPAEIMEMMPDSCCEIDSNGYKRVNVPGEMWSLKILDKILSGENLIDSYDNTRLLEEYGLKAYLKDLNDKKNQDLYNAKYISFNKLLKAIKENKEEKVIKLFLEKYELTPTGNVTPADIINIMPESKCVIDSEGRKRFNVPGGLWSLKLLDKLLSE